MARVALATCAKSPQLHEASEDVGLRALQERGVDAVAAVWDDPGVRWGSFDLVIIRATWDYVERRDEFLGWASSVTRLANPLPVLRWNTDKRYLFDITEAAVPIVPTVFVEPGGELVFPERGEFVVKPTVGAGSVGVGRFNADIPEQLRLAREHAERYLAVGVAVLIQPYQSRIDIYGETNLVFLGGKYSHAVRKHAMLDRAFTEVPPPRPTRVNRRFPLDAEHRLADAAYRKVREVVGVDQLLYARFDMVPGLDGLPMIMEVELTEPALYLDSDVLAPDRFADAVMALLERRESAPTAIGRVPVSRFAGQRIAHR